MASGLDASIVKSFWDCFESRCLTVIGDAYQSINKQRQIDISWDEENISANIYHHIDENVKAIEWNIFVSDECRQYTEKILENKKKAKNSARIDLKMVTNWNKQRVRYFVEAKNLIESDTRKAGRKTVVRAKKWHKRYIETGINHYLDGHYPPNGCLLGYVLQGDPSRIVRLINALLREKSRLNEILIKTDSGFESIDCMYLSRHEISGEARIIKHLMLKFGNFSISPFSAKGA